jgi:hypothetical protein
VVDKASIVGTYCGWRNLRFCSLLEAKTRCGSRLKRRSSTGIGVLIDLATERFVARPPRDEFVDSITVNFQGKQSHFSVRGHDGSAFYA